MQTGTEKFTIAIGGPKGVGKSSILHNVIRFFPGFTIISSGSVLQKVSQAQYGLNFVDLPREAKRVVRRTYTEGVMKETAHTLLDIHYGEFEDGGYPCVIPELLLPHITHFVLVMGNSEAILNRRSHDSKERRADRASVRLNVLGERIIFNELVARYNKENVIIHNKDMQASVQQLAQFIQKVVDQ